MSSIVGLRIPTLSRISSRSLRTISGCSASIYTADVRVDAVYKNHCDVNLVIKVQKTSDEGKIPCLSLPEEY